MAPAVGLEHTALRLTALEFAVSPTTICYFSFLSLNNLRASYLLEDLLSICNNYDPF